MALTAFRTLQRRLRGRAHSYALPGARVAAHAPVPLRARSERPLDEYEEMLRDAADRHEVPAELLQAIAWVASGWRQRDIHGAPLVTPTSHGAMWGCMGLNDQWHPDAFPAARDDAEASAEYAARLLRWLYEQTDDWHRAVATYFGHDSRAEATARRAIRAAAQQPWHERIDRPAALAEAASIG